MDKKQHILVIGDGGVGKTSYIRKKLKRPFQMKYCSTESIHVYEDENCVWYDFPGQEKYGEHRVSGAIHKVIYMYDLTNKLSYDNIKLWKKHIKEHYGIIPSITIGNKTDLQKYIRVENSDIKNSNLLP